MSRYDGSTVLLSDTDEACQLASQLATHARPAQCYGSLAELLRDRGLSGIAVLVLLFRPVPKGVLLATLGRLNVEFPQMRKVVVMDETPPLPIAQYLASCSVDLVPCTPGDETGAHRLASVVKQLQERAAWLMPWASGDLPRLPTAEEMM